MEYEIREPGRTPWATCDNVKDARRKLHKAWDQGLSGAQIYVVEADGSRTLYVLFEDILPPNDNE